ncbi:hypothetical protein COLO4_01525 [Corchorus olitorius]|uniref:Uncharacterized protein n=1 Tax=Corchorus olitorius TaxID=93759 RepID=A0A1R3L2E6_9ROSI|nr:hypothetical protein COLO4_02260 [Corchorus olitorius]OMP13512.1 hypothetical protein COLO4_01525 [Corchorus olitorius]
MEVLPFGAFIKLRKTSTYGATRVEEKASN